MNQRDDPWTDPDPVVVRTTPLTFPFSHVLLGIAACGFLAGVVAVAGESTLSESRGWASLATAAGLMLAALALPRLFRGELVVAGDGIARRYRSRPWKWVPSEVIRQAVLWGDKRWTIDLLGPYGSKARTTWSLLGWRLRHVRDALRAKGYDVDGP